MPPDAPIVAMLSRLNGLKGVDDFLHAAAKVAVRVPGRTLPAHRRWRRPANGAIVKNRSYGDARAGRGSRARPGRSAGLHRVSLDVPELLAEVRGVGAALVERGPLEHAPRVDGRGCAGRGHQRRREPGGGAGGQDAASWCAAQNPEALADRICRVLEDRADGRTPGRRRTPARRRAVFDGAHAARHRTSLSGFVPNRPKWHRRGMLFNSLAFLFAFLPIVYFVFWRLTTQSDSGMSGWP